MGARGEFFLDTRLNSKRPDLGQLLEFTKPNIWQNSISTSPEMKSWEPSPVTNLHSLCLQGQPPTFILRLSPADPYSGPLLQTSTLIQDLPPPTHPGDLQGQLPTPIPGLSPHTHSSKSAPPNLKLSLQTCDGSCTQRWQPTPIPRKILVPGLLFWF